MNKQIETITNESIEQIDYLNNRIETLKNHNIELNKANEQMNNKLAFYENEYQDIVAEKIQYYENRHNHIKEVAKEEINHLKIDIKSYKQQIEDMTKQNDFLHKKIRKMMKK